MSHKPHIERARELRRDMTPAEVILWRDLRSRRFVGYKFRRQRPVGPYFADFCCYHLRLIVELDGDSHLGREEHDARRQTVLESWGYQVLRFWNYCVYDEHEAVLDAIFAACEERTKTLTPGPSPAKPGEGSKS